MHVEIECVNVTYVRFYIPTIKLQNFLVVTGVMYSSKHTTECKKTQCRNRMCQRIILVSNLFRCCRLGVGLSPVLLPLALELDVENLGATSSRQACLAQRQLAHLHVVGSGDQKNRWLNKLDRFCYSICINIIGPPYYSKKHVHLTLFFSLQQDIHLVIIRKLKLRYNHTLSQRWLIAYACGPF